MKLSKFVHAFMEHIWHEFQQQQMCSVIIPQGHTDEGWILEHVFSSCISFNDNTI